MRKKLLYAVALVFFFTIALYSPREASAVPAFARQTGFACNSCHFQHFPTLNAFGRSFKSGGYTMIGGQSLVEGDLLSLPSVLNASLVTKIRYQKRNGDATTGSATELNKGQIQFPDEAGLLIGGRAGEHVGFLLELSLTNADTGNRFTNFKMPVVFDAKGTKLSFIPFTSDTGGPAYGLELLNTGAMRMTKPLEHRREVYAQQYIGTATKATGFTFAASNDLFFVNYTPWYQDHDSNGFVSGAVGPFLNYFRAAATPTVAGWDLGAGVQLWAGTSKRGQANTPTREHASAWSIDAQAQGTVGNLPLGVYTSYARAKKSKSTINADVNIFNSSTNKDLSAWTISAEAGVIPNRLTLSAGLRLGKNGDPLRTGNATDNATTVAAVYSATQNLQVQLDNTWYTGNGKGESTITEATPARGNMLTTLMLFAAF